MQIHNAGRQGGKGSEGTKHAGDKAAKGWKAAVMNGD